MIWLLTKYILTAALRDKLFLGFIAFLAVGVSLSIFFGSAAITEKEQFSIVFAAGGLRVLGGLTLILFTVFYVRKSFETRDVEYLLTRPISRIQFLAAHSIAFSALATIATLLISLVILLISQGISLQGYLLWCFSLWFELLIIAQVALFFSFVLSSAVMATLMGCAFYVLSRLIGGILGVIDAGPTTGAGLVMEKIMLVISVIIPRFDLMTQSSWLLYADYTSFNWSFVLLQGVIFYGFVFSAAYVDFNKRQF